MKRFALVAAAAVVMAGAGGAGAYAWQKQASADERCAKVTAAYEGRELVQVGSGSTSVAILGDSYTAGDNLPDWRSGWAYKMPERRDWTVSVAGYGSTGYLNGGACGNKSYAERLDVALASKPDLLVIQGGLNDTKSTAADVRAAATLLLSRAKEHTAVVVIGPVDAPGLDGEAAVDEALSEAATSAAVPYVSALDWQFEFLPDRLHLTEAGHDRFSRLVAEALPG